jgi:hypothetical protein
MSETADLGLPRVLRSPWRWVGLAIGLTLVLTGISGLAVGIEDVADVVISLLFLAFGGLVSYLFWRSGVVVTEKHVEERGMSGGLSRVAWVDVAEVRVVAGPSILPSRTVALVGRDGAEIITLASLSWYSFRAHKVPSRIVEFRRMASALMEEGNSYPA